jgi:uncharacterized cupin superfamily protein
MGTVCLPPQQSCAALQRRDGLPCAQSWHAMGPKGDAMADIIRLSRNGTPPDVSRPDPSKVLAGDPVHTNWNLETRGNLYAGLWHSTEGIWRCTYGEWEYVHILEGHSIPTDLSGARTHLRAGDSFVIRPGFEGTWQVVQPTLKDYVILL